MQSRGSDKPVPTWRGHPGARPGYWTSESRNSTLGEEGLDIVNDVEGIGSEDGVPEADAVEQRQPVDSDDEVGLDTTYLTAATDRDANEADVVEQAFIVPVDDDWVDDQ